MPASFFVSLIILLCLGTFFATQRKIARVVYRSSKTHHTLPSYYGLSALIWSLITCIIALILEHFLAIDSTIIPAHLPTIAITFITAILAFLLIKPSFKARHHVEKWEKALLLLSTMISVSVTFFIVISVCVEAIRFFAAVPVHEFLFGLTWSPQTAMRADQAGSSGAFGVLPVFVGTMLITMIAMCVAVPLGLFSAIYLSEYATSRLRNITKPVLEILAGIPTVVYGYFAALIIAPYIREAGTWLGLDVASESALAAGFVMGIMIIPFILSLSDDVMHAVPTNLRDASLALGATKAETVTKVVIPAALPGIMGAILLAISRAVGETMIVTMAAGLTANLTFNPFSSVTTVTAQIVTLLVGDQEFDSPKTLAAFALGLTLFIVTLVLNIIALTIVKKYRERYE